MAHIGKVGPLWFRRDTCIGCTNHQRAIGQVQQIFSRFIAHSGPNQGAYTLLGYGFLVTAAAELDAVWKTADLEVGGRTWHLRSLFKRWDQEQQLCKMRIEIWLNGHLSIYRDCFNSTVGNCVNFGNTGAIGFTWWNTGDWPEGVIAEQCTSSRASWGVIPPEA